MTIQEVIDLINARLQGGQARGTLDTFKCGDPSEPVRGIVVTFMATCEVIERAAELGANLLITHEPTFYNHADETGWLSGDGVFLSKQSLIESHGIAIWRFHDGCHKQRPDSIVSGMAQKLGWGFDPEPCVQNTFTIKPQTARSLAQWCKERLNIAMVRVAGDLETVCRRAGLLVGACGGNTQIRLFQESDIDVVICGESPEWETCEYVRDSCAQGKKKALIVLGHANSEEAGMEWIAEWMRSFIPANISIDHLKAGDPFKFV